MRKKQVKMNTLAYYVKSQKGMYSVIFVSVISFVFLVVSLNFSKNIQSYTHFEIVNKETLLRGRAVKYIQEHLYNPSACNKTFDGGSLLNAELIKDKAGAIVFDLSKDTYKDRGFKEKGLPKVKKITILNCNPSQLKNGKAPPTSCLAPSFVKGQSSTYHSMSVLKIDVLKNFLKDEKNLNHLDNFYPVYIPIYLETTSKPSSKLTGFKTCSTFTPILRNFYCPDVLFEFSCCRYIYNMELSAKKMIPKKAICLAKQDSSKIIPTVKEGSKTKSAENCFFPAGVKIPPQKKSPADYSNIIPTAEDPTATKSSADEDCGSSASSAFMSAVCTFSQGWKVNTKCVK